VVDGVPQVDVRKVHAGMLALWAADVVPGAVALLAPVSDGIRSLRPENA